MSSERTHRRLAAIVCMDVAGFSRLMGADEEGTLARLTAIRRDIIDQEIGQCGGRVVKTTGDGLIAEFVSPVEAVRCALEVQEAVASRNADALPNGRLEFRVGINLGDVIVADDDLYGEGVNVAARLQALAEPGGICISGAVHEHVRDKLPAAFVDCGERSLKNIARQVRVFATTPIGGAPRSALPLPDKPSIAVLPFVNLSDKPEQDYFADGITEDIITALARLRWFFVIARNTSFAYKGVSIDIKQVARELGVRYVLEGSVRRSGQAVRVAAQLIDATTGNHIWAERYDRNLTDIFAIQDEITESVAGSIEPELLKTESGAVATRSPADMTGWDLVRQGMWYFHKVTRETHLKACELFRTAAKLDPQLPEAHAWLARVSAGIVAYGWSDDPHADLREGLDAALKAIHLDEKNPYSHYGLAITSAYSDEHEQAKRAAEKAIEVSPSFALGHLALGMARLYSGDAAGAIPPLQRGLRLSPYDPQNFVWYCELALAHLFAGEAQQAVDAATKALKVRPDWLPTLEIMAICFVAAEQVDQARRCAEQIRQAPPAAGDVFAPLRNRNPQWSKQMQALLRKAKTDR